MGFRCADGRDQSSFHSTAGTVFDYGDVKDHCKHITKCLDYSDFEVRRQFISANNLDERVRATLYNNSNQAPDLVAGDL